jgi:predicted DNA-binding protein with PD1-like motif
VSPASIPSRIARPRRCQVEVTTKSHQPGDYVPTHVVQVDKDQEVLQTVQAEVDKLGLSNAVITLIGAVNEATVSVMAKDDESVDHLRRYAQPMELSGTGEVVEGRVHLHVTLAGEDITAAGHLHRAVVGGFFVRAYLTAVDG